MRLPFLLLLTFFIILSHKKGLSQVVYHLNDTTAIHRLDQYVQVFIDSTSKLTINDVSQGEIQKKFKPHKGHLTFGYLKPALWLKVRIKTASPSTRWYLEIPAPFLEYVDFYQRNKNTWHHSTSGYYRANHEKEISHTGHVVRLISSDDPLHTVYIRIAGRSPKTFPLLAIEQERFNQRVRFEDVGYGLFFGILLAMFFFNFFIYLTLKQTPYLLYIFTVICTFLIFVSASGYGGKFLWPENPVMNFYAGRMSLGAMGIFMSVFTLRFLEVQRYTKVMYYVLLSLIPLSVIANILVAARLFSSAGNNLISLCTIVYMVTGIVCSIKGNKTAYYFIAAWAIYLVGGLLLTLRNSGVFDFNFWTTHFVEIGAAMETTIIGFALGDRYRRYKVEKEAAQMHALKLQLGINESLEKKVNERTEQLSKAFEELQVTLETNTMQTQIIENKNAELDAFFYRISHDLKGPVSSLLGLSSLARLEVKDEMAREYIEKQYQQVERLNSIITGLIKLTRLNHAELQKERIDFNKIVDDCIASFNGHPNFHTIRFVKTIDVPVDYFSEWTLINAILQNLIENAIKYAGTDRPFVKIIIRQEAEWIIMEVEDNGQGIAAEHQTKIFEMFYRATDNSTGTGLGLYILKRSVDQLKGTVHIKSEEGRGSLFIVKLPHLHEANVHAVHRHASW